LTVHPTPIALRAIFTLAAAAAGGFAVNAAGVSAGWMVGSALVTILLALVRVPVAVPPPIRNGAFVFLGLALGSGVTPEFAGLVAGNWASFVLLTVAVIVMMLVNATMLVKFFGVDPASAIVGTSPGALSMTLAMAESGFGDPRIVSVLQTMRLALIVTMVPLAIDALGADGASGRFSPDIVTVFAGIALVGAAFVTGMVLARLNVPAAWLLGGVVASAVAHGTGILHGVLPLAMTNAAIVVVGANIGSRFRGVSLRELAKYGFASAIATLIAVLIALGLAWAMGYAAGHELSSVFLSYAPGGVEAMAALALALGISPALVAAHHIFRIVLLTFGLPVAIGWLRRRNPALERQEP
jgi:membrane AbrB-like protein